jgi:hypothetical protein
VIRSCALTTLTNAVNRPFIYKLLSIRNCNGSLRFLRVWSKTTPGKLSAEVEGATFSCYVCCLIVSPVVSEDREKRFSTLRCADGCTDEKIHLVCRQPVVVCLHLAVRLSGWSAQLKPVWTWEASDSRRHSVLVSRFNIGQTLFTLWLF